MSNNKKSEGQYAVYKTSRRWESNRLRKLRRALKSDPNQAKTINEAMSNVVYRRRTPNTTVWSATKRRTAELYKKFAGRCDPDIFHSNEKLAAAALMAPGPYSKDRPKSQAFKEKEMFSIGARFHN